MNVLAVTGNMGADPELRFFESGKSVAKFSICVKKPRSKEDAGWFQVEAWGATAQFLADNAQKGTKVEVKGWIKQDSWVDRETGRNKYAIKLVADEVGILGGWREKDRQHDDGGDHQWDGEF